jgi:hypothetical protein
LGQTAEIFKSAAHTSLVPSWNHKQCLKWHMSIIGRNT